MGDHPLNYESTFSFYSFNNTYTEGISKGLASTKSTSNSK